MSTKEQVESFMRGSLINHLWVDVTAEQVFQDITNALRGYGVDIRAGCTLSNNVKFNRIQMQYLNACEALDMLSDIIGAHWTINISGTIIMVQPNPNTTAIVAP